MQAELKRILVAIFMLVLVVGLDRPLFADDNETEVRLEWAAPVDTEVCAFAIYGAGTPGFLGDPDNILKVVPGNTTTTTIPRDTISDTTVYAAVTIGPALGYTCETTELGQYRQSSLSDHVFVNDTLFYYRNFSSDTDLDGLPDAMETEFTKTDPYNSDSDGDGLPDGFEYALWEEWLENSWSYDFNYNGTNGLNDANSDYIPGVSCPQAEDGEEYWPDRHELYRPLGRLAYSSCE
jgi:hypothetical protein